MSVGNLLLYALVFGFWAWAIRREGGIGIGSRYLYGVTVAVYFLLTPLVEALSVRKVAKVRDMHEAATSLSLAGLLAFLVGGYCVGPALFGRRLFNAPAFWDALRQGDRVRRDRSAVWLLLVLGALAIPVGTVFGRVATLRAVWSQFYLLPETALVMMCLDGHVTRQPRRLLAAFGLWAVFGIFRAATTGFFGGTLLTGIFLLSISLLATRIRPWAVLAFALVLPAAIVPYQVWINNRGRLREAIKKGDSLEHRIDLFVEMFGSPSTKVESTQTLADSLKMRADHSQLLGAAMAHTPEKEPYAEGSTLADTFIAVIPRYLWPDKPYTLGGSAFVTRYTGWRFAPGTSIGVNYLFEFYINFGLPGVLAGMLLLGIAMAAMEFLFYRYALDRPHYEWTIILCSWSVCASADTIAQACMTVPAAVATGWAVGRLIDLLPSLRPVRPANLS